MQAAAEQLRGLAAVTGAQIGVIGYSMGAYWALHLSQVRPDDVGAIWRGLLWDGRRRLQHGAGGLPRSFAEHDDLSRWRPCARWRRRSARRDAR